MPDFAQILAGLNSPRSPLLYPSGLHSAKGLHDFVPVFAKMLVESAEPACLNDEGIAKGTQQVSKDAQSLAGFGSGALQLCHDQEG